MKQIEFHWFPRSLVLYAGLSLMSACSHEARQPPNVILIVVDTLRADRLPFQGGPEDAAPFLDAFAKKSLVFENAWSPSSWTLPATVSLFTSVRPPQHGVGDLLGLELGPEDDPVPVACIPAEVETLSEALSRARYRTFGVASNVLVGAEVGFDRGFDRFIKLEDKDADDVNGIIESWKEEMQASEPYFLYVQYIDPHDTFHAREPWFERARSRLASSWPEGTPEPTENTLANLDWMLTRLAPKPHWLGERKCADLSSEELAQLIDWMRAAYDSEIGFVDARIRQLDAMLPFEESIVFFLADHGEEFYEHGELTHGLNLHAETVRVPLLLHIPGKGAKRGRIKSNVSTLDVLPTLQALLGLPSSHQYSGHDLLQHADRPPVLSHLPGNSGQYPPKADMRSIIVDGYRLIAIAGQPLELYDLPNDPLERSNLAQDLPQMATRMHNQLDLIDGAAKIYPHTTRIPEPASEAMLDHLSGIGYLGDETD